MASLGHTGAMPTHIKGPTYINAFLSYFQIDKQWRLQY